GKLQAASISRADVKAMFASLVDTPAQANLVLANTSVVFSFGVKEDVLTLNPCSKVDRHTTASRERVLGESELPKFWAAFDNAGLMRGTALKLGLLLGQRPGEICHMRHEHIRDGWWELPGKAIAKLNWPGTKNGANHRVWLPKVAQALLA